MFRCSDELRVRALELHSSSRKDAKHYIGTFLIHQSSYNSAVSHLFKDRSFLFLLITYVLRDKISNHILPYIGIFSLQF